MLPLEDAVPLDEVVPLEVDAPLELDPLDVVPVFIPESPDSGPDDEPLPPHAPKWTAPTRTSKAKGQWDRNRPLIDLRIRERLERMGLQVTWIFPATPSARVRWSG